MGNPHLNRDGTLPRGLHGANLKEIREAFGGRTARRVELMLSLEGAVKRAWKAGARRILVDGSFITRKPEPRDVDLVILVDDEFERRLGRRDKNAMFIAERARDRHPKMLDLFLAIDDEEWASWVKLFEQDVWFGRKGLVEVVR
jgi:hypothetical protein